MSKVKLTTVSGTVIEKPVITCFKNEIGTYLVLDNEKNGTMGLPIILVCRLFNNKLSKIIDQGEWQTVKENLKSIISGKEIIYETTPNELNADDVYYTQLTLPVSSFDALKDSYSKFNGAPVETPSTPEEPVTPVEPAAPAEEVTPVAPEIPAVEPVETPNPEPSISTPEPTVEPAPQPVEAAPVMPNIEMPSPEPVAPLAPEVTPVAPEIPAVEPVAPVIPTPEPAPQPTEAESSPAAIDIPQAPIDTPDNIIPTINPEPEAKDTIDTNVDVEEIKKNFMNACENMFDALIIKFQSK